jgi:hypothetical protein
MARQYSDELLILVSQQHDEDNLGFALAKLCIHLNIPAFHVANALGVSRMTIHKWFRGSNIVARKRAIVEEFCKYLACLSSDENFMAGDWHQRSAHVKSWASTTLHVDAR